MRNIDYLMMRLAANATNPDLDADMRCLIAESRAVIETLDYVLRRTLDAMAGRPPKPPASTDTAKGE